MDEPKPRWRWGRWLGAGAAVAVLLALIAYAVYDRSVRSELAGVIAELDASDPGWRLEDILAARSEVPAAANSMSHAMAVAGRVSAGWTDKVASSVLVKLPPNAALNPANRELLAGLLKGVPREAARDLIRFPHGAFETNALYPLWLPNAATFQVLNVVCVLEMDARALAADDRIDDALESARTILRLSQSVEDDPAGQWVRRALPWRGYAVVERVLALGEASDVALARAAGDVVAPTVTVLVRTHRAMLHEALAAVGRGDIDGLEVTRASRMATPLVFGHGGPLVRREMVRREHAQLLRLMTRRVELSKQPPSKQFTEDDAIETEFNTAWGMFTKLTGALLRGVNGNDRWLAASATSLRALIAVERYRLKHKRWPAKLDDVVPEFLEKKPLDPIDEAPLRYVRTADGVVVYSIGNDRTDDGGKVGWSGADVGFRLWDADKRGVRP
jgi:hypothetical protein